MRVYILRRQDAYEGNSEVLGVYASRDTAQAAAHEDIVNIMADVHGLKTTSVSVDWKEGEKVMYSPTVFGATWQIETWVVS